MGVIQVWAPDARCVEVEVQGSRLGMEKDPGGWWRVETSLAEHGADYSFFLDGGAPLPDPRSSWQPVGVHGPSRIVDHTVFPWTDARWRPPPLSSAVIYELHIGTFSLEGTFEGAVNRLDHLVNLGVTHVELMPVAEFSGERGWGYDGVDLYAPHHAYGGPQGLKRLVDACHSRGLAVILDVVYNHLGPEGNYLGRFGRYFTERYVTPWGDALNLDGPHSDEVKRFFVDNALMWLRDYHVDGLRIDAVHAIIDSSPVHFLEQLATEVKDVESFLGRQLVLIAESDLNDPRVIRPQEAGGYGIDAQWNEDFHHALHAVLTGERCGYYQDFGALSDLAKVLTRGFVYDGAYSRYRQRSHGRPAVGLSGHRFVACLQNHDQVGNRAAGERTSRLLSQGRLKIGAAMILLSPFIPMLFQGEEWGASSPFLYFADYKDPELGEAVRKGRQKEFAGFGWRPEDMVDPLAFETFERSKLAWEELQKEPHGGLFDWHRRLIRIRRAFPELLDGRIDRVEVTFDEEKRWLVIERGPITMVCNLADQAQSIFMKRGEKFRLLMASEEGARTGVGSVWLPPEAVAILSTAH